MKKIFSEIEVDIFDCEENVLLNSAFISGGRYDTDDPDWNFFD